MTYRTKFILLVFAAVLVLGAGGCSKKGNAERSLESGSVKDRSSGTAAREDSKRKLVFGALKKNKEPEKKAASLVSDLAKGDYSVMLVSLPSSDVFPEDMIIGELQNPYSLAPAQRELFEEIKKFISEAFKGKVYEKGVDPSYREMITRILKKASPKGSVSVRIGKFIFKDEYSEIPVRLLSPTGRTEGSVVAVKEGDRWLITGLSVDFNKIKEKYEPAEEPYEPDSYMNLRLEY